MNVPLTFLLFGVAVFLFLAVISFIRGFNLKEKAYCINGLVSAMLSCSFLLMFLEQFVIGIGCFIAGAIIGLANYSKTMAAASREAVTQHVETDLSKPLKPAEILSWSGWFKIANKWGKTKSTVFYVLFNLAFIWLVPVLLLIFNFDSPSFVLLSVITVVGVMVSSVAIFNQQVIRNLKNHP